MISHSTRHSQWSAVKKYYAATLLLCMVAGCRGHVQDDPYFITVHQLRIEYERYIGHEVVIKGYLSGRLWEGVWPPYLYATSDDATMRNQSASVFIDVHNNPRLVELADCMERFVEVKGTFRETDDPELRGLGIAGIHYMRIVPDSADRGFDAYCVRPGAIEGEGG